MNTTRIIQFARNVAQISKETIMLFATGYACPNNIGGVPSRKESELGIKRILMLETRGNHKNQADV